MKLLSIILICGSAFAQPAFVGATKSADASGSSTTLLLTRTTTAGNALVVVADADTSAAKTVSASDTLGSTWTHPTSVNETTHLQDDIFCAASTTGGSDTVTITWSGAVTFRQMIIYEVSGMTCTLDGTALSTTGTTTGLVTIGNLVTAHAADFLFSSVGSFNSATTFTAGSGWTVPTNGFRNTADSLGTEYQIISSTGTYAATITLGGTVTHYLAQALAFTATDPPIIPKGRSSNTLITARPVDTISLAWLSDVHREDWCLNPAATTNFGTGSLPNVYQKIVARNPDYIAVSGDMTQNSLPAEESQCVLVNSLTNVTTPGLTTITVDPATLNGSLYIYGDPSLDLPHGFTMYVVDEGKANEEYVFAGSSPPVDSTHLALNFAKTHVAPFMIRNASGTRWTYWKVRKDSNGNSRLLVTPGNHDEVAGNSTWCTPISACTTDQNSNPLNNPTECCQLNAFLSYYAGGGPNAWFVQKMNVPGFPAGCLLKVIGIDTMGDASRTGPTSAQATALSNDVNVQECQWTIATGHYPMRTPCVSDGTGGMTNRGWVAGDAVDLSINGHWHNYHHTRAPNYSGSRTIDFLTVGWFNWQATGTGLPSDPWSACTFSCGSGCTVVDGYSDTRGYVMLSVSPHKLIVTAYKDDDTVFETFTISK